MNKPMTNETLLSTKNIPRDAAAPWKIILIAGIASATFDILFAMIFYGLRVGVAPMRLLQGIASGLYGMSSFDGGASTAIVGLIAHYVILIIASAMYYAASRYLPVIHRQVIVCGVIYGAAIYVVMHYVIVPLSAAPTFKFNLVNNSCEFVNHLVLGVIIAMIIVRRGFARS